MIAPQKPPKLPPRHSVRTLAERLFMTFDCQNQKQCLRWALAAVLSLEKHGIHACINAGTANFQANDMPEPHPTHVGYFWQDEDDDTIQRYLQLGILPEMHCWAVVPSLNMIVDPTTQFLPHIAAEKRIPWTKPYPPEWFWGMSPPTGWCYTPHERACLLAADLAMQVVKGQSHLC